jgi:hypothetical protein
MVEDNTTPTMFNQKKYIPSICFLSWFFFYESAEKAPTSSFSLNKFNKRLCTDKGERPKEREREKPLKAHYSTNYSRERWC